MRGGYRRVKQNRHLPAGVMAELERVARVAEVAIKQKKRRREVQRIARGK
jgi:hypothetical protein